MLFESGVLPLSHFQYRCWETDKKIIQALGKKCEYLGISNNILVRRSKLIQPTKTELGSLIKFAFGLAEDAA